MKRDYKSVNDSSRKELRLALRSSCTEFENILWQKVRNNALGYRCKRQVSIGRYIVDFCFLSKKLVVEIDGVQHDIQQEYDNLRTRELESLGYKVLRFSNKEIIENLEKVLDAIYDSLNT